MNLCYSANNNHDSLLPKHRNHTEYSVKCAEVTNEKTSTSTMFMPYTGKTSEVSHFNINLSNAK